MAKIWKFNSDGDYGLFEESDHEKAHRLNVEAAEKKKDPPPVTYTHAAQPGFIHGTNVSLDSADDLSTPEHEGHTISAELYKAVQEDDVDKYTKENVEKLIEKESGKEIQSGLLDITIKPIADSGGYTWVDDVAPGASFESGGGIDAITGKPETDFYSRGAGTVDQHDAYLDWRDAGGGIAWPGGDPSRTFGREGSWDTGLYDKWLADRGGLENVIDMVNLGKITSGGLETQGLLNSGLVSGLGNNSGLGSRGYGEYLSTPYQRPALRDFSDVMPDAGLLQTKAQQELADQQGILYQPQAYDFGLIPYTQRSGLTSGYTPPGSGYVPPPGGSTTPPPPVVTPPVVPPVVNNGTLPGLSNLLTFNERLASNHEDLYRNKKAAADLAGFSGLDATNLNPDYVAYQNLIKDYMSDPSNIPESGKTFVGGWLNPATTYMANYNTQPLGEGNKFMGDQHWNPFFGNMTPSEINAAIGYETGE